MHKIADNLAQVRDSVQTAAEAVGRNQSAVTLLAVSKKQPVEAVEQAYAAGQRHFGESYLQEALNKIAEIHHPDVIWHFIGPIQSNKTQAIASHFSWVHSVDRLKVADRLSRRRSPQLPPLNICLQVNIDDEASKSGCDPAEAPDLASAIARLPNLRLRGLMAIPDPAREPRASFARLRELAQKIERASHVRLDTLSMGMSGDLADAIAEGATIVRVGTAIFGERD